MREYWAQVGMIEVPEKAVKELLEVIDDVGYYLHTREDYDDGSSWDLLRRLKTAKDQFENTAKTK
jgi:hypothetical protein